MATSDPKNIFVVGLDDHNLSELKTIRDAENFRFHSLLDLKEVKQTHRYRIEELMDRAEAILNDFDGTIDAIIGFWDFPVSLMVPLLCRRYDMPGPSLESVLKCGRKTTSGRCRIGFPALR